MTAPTKTTTAVPTLEDVALRAGVSRSTASRVVNCVPNVRPDTRRSVLRAVDELGYVPNTAAASLVTRRSRQVALVVCEAFAADDPVLAGAVREVTGELSAAGMSCLVSVLRDTDDPATLSHRLRTVGIDGAIVVAGDSAQATLCGHLRAVHIPVVSLPGGATPGRGGGAARAGARRLVDRLKDHPADQGPPRRSRTTPPIKDRSGCFDL